MKNKTKNIFKILITVLMIAFIPKLTFADDLIENDNTGLLTLNLDKSEYSWHEEITAKIRLENVFDEDISVTFDGTCFINTKITNDNFNYDEPNPFCISSNKTIDLAPGDYRTFTYTLNLEALAGIAEGSYSFDAYIKPIIYKGSTRYSKDTFKLSQSFDFEGNIAMNLYFLNDTNSYTDSDKINVKWNLVNNSTRSYYMNLDPCDSLYISIYKYYSKEKIYETEAIEDCKQNSKQIELKANGGKYSSELLAYDPKEFGNLGSGLYVMKIKFNSDTLSPESTFSEPFEITNSKNIFKDISGHWGENFIINLFKKGIINGYNDSTFKPNQTITKAEFLKIALNSLNKKILKLDDILIQSLVDVTSGDWFFRFVETALNENIISRDTNYFSPNENIKRIDAFKILYNGLSKDNKYSLYYNVFTDIGEENHIKIAMTLYNLGIVNGNGASTNANQSVARTLNSESTLTRAEASKIALISNEVAEKEKEINNNNILLRYYKYGENLNSTKEYDVVVCENGRLGLYYMDPDDNNGAYYFTSQISQEDIINKVLKKLYDYNFFRNKGYFENCEGENKCEEDVSESLAYFYSNLSSELSGLGLDNFDWFKSLKGDLLNYFITFKSSSTLNKVDEKKYDKYFGEGFCN